MMRQRSRLERLRKAATNVFGCPECQPQVIEIIEVIVDGPEAAAASEPRSGPLPPTHCQRCGREKPIRFVEFPVSASAEGADIPGD